MLDGRSSGPLPRCCLSQVGRAFGAVAIERNVGSGAIELSTGTMKSRHTHTDTHSNTDTHADTPPPARPPRRYSVRPVEKEQAKQYHLLVISPHCILKHY